MKAQSQLHRRCASEREKRTSTKKWHEKPKSYETWQEFRNCRFRKKAASDLGLENRAFRTTYIKSS